MSIIWEFIRNGNSRAHPGPIESETLMEGPTNLFPQALQTILMRAKV